MILFDSDLYFGRPNFNANFVICLFVSCIFPVFFCLVAVKSRSELKNGKTESTRNKFGFLKR